GPSRAEAGRPRSKEPPKPGGKRRTDHYRATVRRMSGIAWSSPLTEEVATRGSCSGASTDSRLLAERFGSVAGPAARTSTQGTPGCAPGQLHPFVRPVSLKTPFLPKLPSGQRVP